MEDDIRQHINSLGKVLLQYRRIIDRVFFRGKGIQIATHTLQTINHLQGMTTVRPLKSDMLTEMSQSLLSHFLITSSGSYDIAAIHHR